MRRPDASWLTSLSIRTHRFSRFQSRSPIRRIHTCGRSPITSGGNWDELRDLSPAEAFDKQWGTGEIDIGLVTRTTGHRGIEISDGAYTLEWPASPWFSAGLPFMYGGAIAWALDTAIEGAIWSTLDAGEFNASLDLHVRYLQPVVLDGGMLTVRGEVQHRGHRMRVATAEMTNAAGARVAMATGSALLVPGGIDHLLGGGATDELDVHETPTLHHFMGGGPGK